MKTALIFSLIFLTAIFILLPVKHLRAQAVAYLESVERSLDPHSGLLVTPDGRYIIKSSYQNASKNQILFISVFDVKTFRLIRSIKLKGNGIPLKLTSNGKFLIFATNATGEFIYQYIDFITGQIVKELKPYSQEGWATDVINDSTFLYSSNQIYYGQKKISNGNISTKSTIDYGLNAKFCNRGSNILTYNQGKVYLWDLKSSIPIDIYDCGPELVNIEVAPNSKHFAVCTTDRKSKTFYFSVENGKLNFITTFPSSFHDIYFNIDYLYLVEKTEIKKFRTRDGELLFVAQLKDYIKIMNLINEYSTALDLLLIEKLPGTEYLLVTDMQNLTHLVSIRSNKVMAYLYSWGEKDYAFITPDGRMEGTKTAIERLQWIGGYMNIPLASTYNQMYTPNLMSLFFTNTLVPNVVNLQNLVKFSPEVKITSPVSGTKTTNPTIEVSFELKENGDEIKEVQIYINDKLVNDETRGMKSAGTRTTVSVSLLPGENTIKVLAISKYGYQSSPAKILVTYTGTVAEASLFVLAIGIDKYKNSSYNLNYAVADAAGIVEKIKSSSKEIFKSINIYFYKNEEAIKDSVIAGLNRIAVQSQPQDAFLLFYAGHGVMTEGTADVPKDFYLALTDVTQLQGQDDILKAKGISAAELQELSKKVTAQKQIILLDACQSGAAVETFAMRGAAAEKAILQLARATGSYLIASTGSEQFATEFKELGHGVFTYALLQGLNCKSADSQLNKKVTIKELEAFLNDYIPELTEKYRGVPQYPKSWSKGMDFPITICN